MPKSWTFSSVTTLEHNDIFAVHKYRYMHVYKNRPGNKKREAVAQKLSNVRMYGTSVFVISILISSYFVSSLSSMNRCRK